MCLCGSESSHGSRVVAQAAAVVGASDAVAGSSTQNSGDSGVSALCTELESLLMQVKSRPSFELCCLC